MLRQRNLRFVVLVFIGIITMVYLIGVVLYAWQTKILAREMAVIKAKGEPVCATELYGSPIPDNQNAALAYQLIFRAVSSKKADQDLKCIRQYLSRCSGSGEPLSSDEFASLRVLVKTYDHIIPKVEAAAAQPWCKFRVQWEKTFLAEVPHLAKLRDINSLICADAVVEAKAGNRERAVADIVLSLEVSDAIRNQPHIVSQLVRYSMINTATNTLSTILKSGTVEEVRAAKLDQALRHVEIWRSYKAMLAGERASFRTMFDDLIAGKVALDDRDAGLQGAILRKIPYFKAWLRADENFLISYLTAQVDASDHCYRELGRKKVVPNCPGYAVMSKSLLKVYPNVMLLRDQVMAELAGSRIALSLNAYKARYHAYPERLEDLSTRMHFPLPKDPFSGRQFIYKRDRDGYLLYSIGKDLKDSGGTESPAQGKDDAVPHDIVWRTGN